MILKALRYGMIGGGPGAFIGNVHRIAARLDGLYSLTAGAFSSDFHKCKETAAELNIARAYPSWAEMLQAESALPADERIEVVVIVTPNHLHAEASISALEAGFHVILDKPLCTSMEEAKAIREAVHAAQARGLHFCLTHTYSGYPMIKEGRAQVAAGRIGHVRKLYVEYPQGWLSTFLEGDGQKQASWRTDPARSGRVGAMGDIGTHAFQLLEYVSGERVTEVCADLRAVVPGRALDDDGAVLFRTASGASGVLIATQVAAGEENNLRIRVYGEKGGLDWQQADNNSLVIKALDAPEIRLRAGGPGTSAISQKHTRVPAGHPEGYLEAFANLYRNFAWQIAASRGLHEADPDLDFPGISDGVRGMAFIDAILRSQGTFVPLKD